MIEKVRIGSEDARKQLSKAQYDIAKEANETGAQCISKIENLKSQINELELKLKQFEDSEEDDASAGDTGDNPNE